MKDEKAYGTRTRWLRVRGSVAIARHTETALRKAFYLLGLRFALPIETRTLGSAPTRSEWYNPEPELRTSTVLSD
jgi:hypothetical protein